MTPDAVSAALLKTDAELKEQAFRGRLARNRQVQLHARLLVFGISDPTAMPECRLCWE